MHLTVAIIRTSIYNTKYMCQLSGHNSRDVPCGIFISTKININIKDCITLNIQCSMIEDKNAFYKRKEKARPLHLFYK